MISRSLSKKDITTLVLKHIPKHVNYDLSGRLTADDFISKWWYTGRSAGLRLTVSGDAAFKMAEIESYEYLIHPRLTIPHSEMLLALNKKIKCPYFLDLGLKHSVYPLNLRVYDSQVAMMIGIFGNDVVEYLNSIRIQHG